MHYNRRITEDIEKHLFQGKIIVIYGPRRVGKTTLSKEILEKYKAEKKTLYLTADDITVQQNLSSQDSVKLKHYLGDAELVLIDEAQRIKNIGINLKILIDSYPEMQLIVTGSSSFDLANEINEPLTGRVWDYFLPPLSINELRQQFSTPSLYSFLPNLLKFGLYPEIITSSGQDVLKRLEEIVKHYLFKDVLDFEGQKNSEFIFKLIQLLAFQIGSEVSYTEIARTLEVSKTLVEKYIVLLEKTFIVFRLQPFSRNLRREIGKKRKIYFWDIGIRNAVIQNFNEPQIRPDLGHLWENFCIAERIKHLRTSQLFRSLFYRRTYNQKEIDYLEEYNGKLHGYEIKWQEDKIKLDREFMETYPESSIDLVNKDNFLSFVEGKI